MTTEDDFQTALDAHPDDAHTRLVFADWLDERDDPRGPGYRALGAARRRPHGFSSGWYWHARVPRVFAIYDSDDCSTLVGDWWDATLPKQKPFTTRREAEDAAATALSKLPAERQREILNPEPVGA